MKVLLILPDGMRPDALKNIPLARELMKKSTYSLMAETVAPSVTLPCHISLFHSVTPARHGTTTNAYAPQVRPIDGLCEVLHKAKKSCAFFYNWEPLRDLSRPGSLDYVLYQRVQGGLYEDSDAFLTNSAIQYIQDSRPDFVFLYMIHPDGAGHDHGWMSEAYHNSIRKVWDKIGRVLETLPEDYSVIITSDHGGHDRNHGTDLPEDMLIPLFLLGKDFKPGKQLETANILDIAPTVTALLGVEPNPDWEGNSLL